jgi:hypothetical protein
MTKKTLSLLPRFIGQAERVLCWRTTALLLSILPEIVPLAEPCEQAASGKSVV